LKPNIFFILLDGFRADKCYGDKKTSLTPNINSLIKNGTYFEQAISSGQGTIPCVASIFTSLYPFECLVEDGNLFKLNSNIQSHVKHLRDNGFDTHATFQEVMHYVGMQEMFVNVDPYPISLSLWGGKGKKIIDKLSSKTMKEPWVYYLHLYDLHMLGYPYEQRLKVGPQEIHDEKYGNNHYERIISAIDFWLGKILEKIDLEKTLVVLTADHGIEHGAYTPEMWELHNQSREKKKQSDISNPKTSAYKLGHKIATNAPGFLSPLRKKLAGMYTDRADKKSRKEVLSGVEGKIKNKTLSPYEERLMKECGMHVAHIYDDRVRVPLIFSGPNIQSGKIISQQVRSIDIFPTITNLVGLPEKSKSHGVSLVPLLKGEKLEEQPVFMETAVNTNKSLSSNTIGVRNSEYKYFRDRDIETKNIHLYDLKNDPLEEKNIFKEKSDIAKNMELQLTKILNEQKITFEKSENTITDDEREQAITKLRKLGYI
jgi:arylsulfatase A-like enzyme